MEDAGAGGAWRVWLGVRSGWGVSNLCQPPRKAILAFSGGFGNLPIEDCHPAGRARSWGSRRGSRNPDIGSELPGVGFVRIWARSYVVPIALLEGVVSSQRRAQVLPIREREEACTGGVREGCTGAPYKRERGGVHKRVRAEVSGAMSYGCGKVSDTQGLHKDPALASYNPNCTFWAWAASFTIW